MGGHGDHFNTVVVIESGRTPGYRMNMEVLRGVGGWKIHAEEEDSRIE